MVKTLLFHGRIAGPTPASVTIWESRIAAIAVGCKPIGLTVFIGSSPISPTIHWAKSKVQGPTQRCEISQFHSYADDDAAEFKER